MKKHQKLKNLLPSKRGHSGLLWHPDGKINTTFRQSTAYNRKRGVQDYIDLPMLCTYINTDNNKNDTFIALFQR